MDPEHAHENEDRAEVAPRVKKAWHKPVHSELEFDRTGMTGVGSPCDSGCCCCAYTPS